MGSYTEGQISNKPENPIKFLKLVYKSSQQQKWMKIDNKKIKGSYYTMYKNSYIVFKINYLVQKKNGNCE